MIRAIVCGGRDYSDRQAVFAALDELRPDVVIQGAAKGADALAFEWCRLRHVECWNVPADWKTHGKAAGPIRNRRMLEEYRANLLIAFPGGAGTADMIRQAEAASIKVLRRPSPAPNVDATVRDGIIAALIAMKLAAALPGVSKEYDFAEAIAATEAAWLSVKDGAPAPQQHVVGPDWLTVAKLAGEHGVRYQTNTRMKRFLAALGVNVEGLE